MVEVELEEGVGIWGNGVETTSEDGEKEERKLTEFLVLEGKLCVNHGDGDDDRKSKEKRF